MENIIISLSLSSILALFAVYKKAITQSGIIMAWFLSVIITYCGGIVSFIILLMTFISIIITDKLLHKKRDKILTSINEKHGKRDLIQILANVGIGTISLIIYHFTTTNIYLITYACIMASSSADSMASEIGVLSKQIPIDICTFKKTTRGISGGITLLGLSSSLLGSFIIALVFYLMTDFSLAVLLFITILGLIGSIIDSILGSTIQVKYQCVKCNKLTEKDNHCDNEIKYVKGIKIINNDIVNLLNNISVFLISIFLLIKLSIF